VIGTLTNIPAMLSLAAMRRHGQSMAQSMERLATGRRINRASDDPAGLVAAGSMELELRSISKQIDRNQLEDKRLGAIDGAQSVISDLVLELQGLVTQAANRDGYSHAERDAMQEQADSILQTIDHLAEGTTFNGDQIIAHLNSRALGLRALARAGEQNLLTGDLVAGQATVDSAVSALAEGRAGVGLRMQEIACDLRVLQTNFEGLSAAHSQIMDTDYAAETGNLIRATMLRDAAQFVAILALQRNKELVQKLLAPAPAA
jgi:flagellin